MSDSCCEPSADSLTALYRRVLWTVFAINAGMALIETATGVLAGSASLQADALDFLGDSANYLIALFVLDRSIRWRASTALLKGGAMGAFGLYVLGVALYHALTPGAPHAPVMGAVGALALIANVASAALLYRHRNGDSNRRAVWLCSRNDAIANLAVIAAAGGVALTASGWPDLVVATMMALLALSSALRILRQASAELRADAGQAAQ